MKKNTLQTLENSIKVLKLFSPTKSEFTLTEFHKELNLSMPSLQRILKTLVQEGMLEKDSETKDYRLGLELYFLGRLVENKSRLITISQKYMKELNQKTEEAITLNIINQNKRQCIEYISAKHELTTVASISNESPLYAGASAKVLLAFMQEDEREDYLNNIEFKKITKHTIINKDDLLKELKEIRKNEYSITESERVFGVFAISTPIINRFDEIIASITITIPSVRVNKSIKEFYIDLASKYAKLISKELEGDTTLQLN